MKTLKGLVLISAIAAASTLSACSNTPGASASLPAVSMPAVSIDPSAAAGAVVGFLEQLDSEITANQTATALTAEERDALKATVAKIRTAVQTGDFSAAQPAVDELKAKVAELDAKLNTPEGLRLKAALAQVEALLNR
jgi:septal ring factor EnvC (AmiA/AmiB activator)